jgi:hypothetical protein
LEWRYRIGGRVEGEWYISGEVCKKVLRIPGFAAIGVAELELGRDNRRQGIVFSCKILVKNFADGQGRTNKRVL